MLHNIHKVMKIMEDIKLSKALMFLVYNNVVANKCHLRTADFPQIFLISELPVLVFIHGESWSWGSSNLYDGRILATLGQIIVVTFNYRIGVLGKLMQVRQIHEQLF